MLVGTLCALGAGFALWAAAELAWYLWTLRLSKLANPPRPGLLPVILALLAALAVLLAVASWRTWQAGSPQQKTAARWSPMAGALWALVLGFLLAVNFPVPPQAHHVDKFFIGTAAVLLWSLWFLLHPGSLRVLLAGRAFSWTTLLLVNVIVFLVAGEALFRLGDPLLARSGLFGDKQTPANLKPHTAVRGSIRVTNSQGFRDRERKVDRTGPGPRILALGDSFTWGAGVTYDETFVTALERALQASSPDAEVINLGVPAWGPHEEFHLLKAYGSRFAPDLVLLNFFIGNDIQNKRGDDTSLPQILVVAGQSYYVHRNGNWVHDVLGPDRWYLFHNLNYLVRVGASRVFRPGGGPAGEMHGEWVPLVSRTQYLKAIHERSDIYLKDNTPFFEFHWTRTQAILRDLRDYLRARGIPLLVVLLPDHVQLDRALQNEYLAAFRLSAEGYDFEKPQRLLRAWCAQQGIEVVDLLPALQAEPEVRALYFQNDIHWTARGHAVAADAILPALRARYVGRDNAMLGCCS